MVVIGVDGREEEVVIGVDGNEEKEEVVEEVKVVEELDD